MHIDDTRQQTPVNAATHTKLPPLAATIMPAIGDPINAAIPDAAWLIPILTPISSIGDILATSTGNMLRLGLKLNPNSKTKAIVIPSLVANIHRVKAEIAETPVKKIMVFHTPRRSAT
jgi:hypothetical protein